MAVADQLILDSGAVIALAHGDQRARLHLRVAERHGLLVVVPAVVRAGTVRGRADDAPFNRVLKAVDRIAEATEEDGREAGRLLGETAMSSTIDALVVATTERIGGGVMLTSDPDDLHRLAESKPTVAVLGL